MKRRTFIKQTGLFTGGVILNKFNLHGKTKIREKFKIYGWWNAPSLKKDELLAKLEEFKQRGISGLLVRGSGENIEKLARAAEKLNIEIHVWMWSLLDGNPQIVENNPEWYNVNRKGVSSLEKPPYVGYYKWLCPSREPVIEYLIDKALGYIKVPNVKGVHLDYIRYPDVILPQALQPKYGLNQTHEFPEYDFCYCEVCRQKFKDKYGQDPLKLKNPSQNKAWVNFRYQRVTNLVNRIADKVHKKSKKITAAVFPTPKIARKLVRQNWPAWNLDGVFPMMYNNYYNKPVSWIENASREGQKALGGKFPLYSGIYANRLKPKEISQAIKYAQKGGADGISLFNLHGMNAEKWKLWSKKTKME
mgnify:FL=1